MSKYFFGDPTVERDYWQNFYKNIGKPRADAAMKAYEKFMESGNVEDLLDDQPESVDDG